MESPEGAALGDAVPCATQMQALEMEPEEASKEHNPTRSYMLALAVSGAVCVAILLIVWLLLGDDPPGTGTGASDSSEQPAYMRNADPANEWTPPAAKELVL